MPEWLVAHYDVLKDFSAPVLTVVGFTITIMLAVAGFRTFNKWKREIIEERRIDTPVEALSLSYESKYIFENIRSPLSANYEWKEMVKQPGETDEQWNKQS